MTEADTTENSEPPGERSTTPSILPALSVDLADPQHRLDDSARSWLRDAIARSLIILQSPGEARIRIVGDAEMAAAHEEYLGEPGTTDVITFDMSEPPGDTPNDTSEDTPGGTPASGLILDTDILICFDEALRQSTDRAHPVEHELLLYVVHGILHCLGHDDHDPDAAAQMHAAEDQVLTTLGIGATYSRPAPSERDLR